MIAAFFLSALSAASPDTATPVTARLTLEHRLRAEGLRHDSRVVAGDAGDAGGLFLRTLGAVDVQAGPFVGTIELIDARALLIGGPPSTAHVNALDLLQASVGLRMSNVVEDGDQLELRVGRRTVDLGTRRLVARNEFRNTINAFTGVDLAWRGELAAARFFVLTPVSRMPDDEALRGDPASVTLLPPWQPDVERGDLLVGAWAGMSHSGIDIELTALWFDEGDDGRRLLSPSLLFRRAPQTGAVDFAVEVMPQLGTVSTTDGVRERRAFSLHTSVGHRFAIAGQPRAAVFWDHATGDAAGDIDERFDPFFAARRFEFGPTGLFGPLARTNLSSPGVRLELAPATRPRSSSWDGEPGWPPPTTAGQLAIGASPPTAPAPSSVASAGCGSGRGPEAPSSPRSGRPSSSLAPSSPLSTASLMPLLSSPGLCSRAGSRPEGPWCQACRWNGRRRQRCRRLRTLPC